MATFPGMENSNSGQDRNGKASGGSGVGGGGGGVGGGGHGGAGPGGLGNGVGRSPHGPSPQRPSPESELQAHLQEWMSGDWWRWLQVQPSRASTQHSHPHSQAHPQAHPHTHSQSHLHTHPQPPSQSWASGDVKPHLQSLWWREAAGGPPNLHPGNLPTVMSTPMTPATASEWQLYRVLQRANLLQYYETFINQGGDDVQQLCEAGEEEFLEIMALVGMAAKPLHVRRLQKALQEWVANPAAFQGNTLPQTIPAPGSISAVMRDQQATLHFPTVTTVQQHQPQQQSQQQPQQQQSTHQQQQPSQQQQAQPPQQSTPVMPKQSWTPQSLGAQSMSPTPQEAHSPTSMSPQSDVKDPYLVQHAQNSGCNSPSQPTPYLDETQINAISDAAAELVKTLPPIDAKEANTKKQVSKEIHAVMSMPEDDPNRMDELRKYAAIYGRFDSKRKAERPMTLHEMSVNEAAAQLCRHIPALLTRRDDLFPLARTVVRNSGYVYSKGHSRSPNQMEKVRPAVLGMTNGYMPGMSGSASAADLMKPQIWGDRQTEKEMRKKTKKGVSHIPKAMKHATRVALNDQLIFIGQEMESLDRCQNELRIALESASPEKKESLMQELEAMTIKMREFNSQKVSIAAQLQRLERKKKNHHHVNGEDDNDGDSSRAMSGTSGNSSPREDVIEEGDIGVVLVSPFGRSHNHRQIIRNTLMNVGLQLAKEYDQGNLAGVEGIDGNSSYAHQGTGASGRDNEEDESLPVLERQVPGRANYASGDDDDENSHPPNLFVQGSDGREGPMQASKPHQAASQNGGVVNGNGTPATTCTPTSSTPTTSTGNGRGRKRKNSRPMHHPISESPTPAKMGKVVENGESPITV